MQEKYLGSNELRLHVPSQFSSYIKKSICKSFSELREGFTWRYRHAMKLTFPFGWTIGVGIQGGHAGYPISPYSSCTDKLIWSGGADGVYSTKSGYQLLTLNSSTVENVNVAWV
ncbi:unnamed protein product [Dovyalis caffra]|uniref:Uncharacterized protein n=1 Tax=Dovyalis caffra TaxID=77055 RepID=A0AAV1RZ75_9ROSI|nr:unnamed protein product [Dovyalis caffra]